MIEKKVKIIKKIFKSDQGDYRVYKTRSLDSAKSELVITGNLDSYSRGEILQVRGEIHVHPRFGPQLKVKEHELCKPSDQSGMIQYLSSPRFRGVGVKTAEKIVAHFGERAIDTVEKAPERLSEISGISGRVIEMLKNLEHDHRLLRELQLFLLPYGLGPAKIRLIFDRFKDHSLKIARENPYLLIDEIEGVGFLKADQIARANGVNREDRFRIKAGIDQVISRIINQDKSLGFSLPQLVEKTSVLLDIPVKPIGEMIGDLIQTRELIRHSREDPPVLYRYRSYQMERQSAQKLLSILHHPPKEGPHPNVINPDRYRPSRGMILSAEQREAVKAAMTHKITIISGGPGTGKTTLISIILKIYGSTGHTINITAPTGRAAKRIFEATGFQAQTIHRLLKINPQTATFHYHRDNPLPLDLLIVDEFSMVDSLLFFHLLNALPDSARLILIGDKDQLPSVGPGNVLADLLASHRFKTIFLKRNFRQQHDSNIVENAHRIKNRQALIQVPYSPDLDFVTVNIRNEGQAIAKIMGILDHHRDRYPYHSFHYQILSPVYAGLSGIDHINQQIQERYNPHPVLYRDETRVLKQEDKVMQIRNDYQKGVFNGELGRIRSRTPGGEQIRIQFDSGLIDYERKDLDQIMLAYAVSIHKAQGSEFDLVILLMLPHHQPFLKREIFYTGVTRAKKRLILLSTRETVEKAIQSSLPLHRKTSLKYHLQASPRLPDRPK